MKYIDLTHIFTKDMPVFPGDAAAELLPTALVAKDGVSDQKVISGMHVGTHMDSPGHMLIGGKLLSDYPVEKFFGRAVIIDARGKKSAEEEVIVSASIKKGDIVLVCFGWSSEFHEDEYYINYPEISKAFSERLVELGVSMIGMDSPSPDRAPYEVHKILLKGDILIIENLTNLERLIGRQNFEIIALPAKFQADAAFCRVVAKII
ncbi:MAG: cyclase family protein [Patescibacteria group bacterium]